MLCGLGRPYSYQDNSQVHHAKILKAYADRATGC